MPVIFLTVRAFKFVKFVRFAPFKAMPPVAQKAIMLRMVREAAVGAAIRSAGMFALGYIIDPYNRFLVPLSNGLLITSDQAAVNILNFDFTDPRTAAAVMIAGPDVAIDLGIDLASATYRGLKEGTMMAVGIAKGSIKTALHL